MLIVKGHDPRDDQETFARFADVFIEGRIVSNKYTAVKEMYDRATDKLAPGARGDILHYAVGFLQHIQELYASMDSSFNFPLQEKITQKSETRVNELDLRGTPCPINYVKTKLVLEELEFGAILAVLLDEGEPIVNVPRSLKEDGHEISGIEDKQGFYRVVVKNGGGKK